MSKYQEAGPDPVQMQGFQLVASSVRRDGLHHRVYGLYPRLADAMKALTQLEVALEPCWVAGVRGLPVGCAPDDFTGYKAPVKESRPFKLYAVKATLPGSGDIVWSTVWAGSDYEARRLAYAYNRQQPGRRILSTILLGIEQEKDLLSGPVTSDRVEQCVLWQQLDQRGGADNA